MNVKEPLTITHPELCMEWSERNFPFLPQDETAQSYSKVWWKGKCGHEWYASIHNRASKHRNAGCPYCAGRELLRGYNDLVSRVPQLLEQWDYNTNVDLDPYKMYWKSSMKVGWICEKGHRWVTSVRNRISGNGCPICAKEMLQVGVNDLLTTHPGLCEEWSERNGDLKPDMVRAAYKRQVWWKCSICGGEYLCQVFSRTYYAKKRCPFCEKREVQKGLNDLQFTHPRIAEEWDYDKNGIYAPTDVTSLSTKYIWWKCSQGHSWGASVRERIEEECSCPVCNGVIVEIISDDIEPVPDTQPKKMKPKTLRKISVEEIDEAYSSIKNLQLVQNYVKHQNNLTEIKKLPIEERYVLTVEEASQYFTIGINKLREFINNNREADYLEWQGRNVFIRRKAFEQYLDRLTEFKVECL